MGPGHYHADALRHHTSSVEQLFFSRLLNFLFFLSDYLFGLILCDSRNIENANRAIK